MRDYKILCKELNSFVGGDENEFVTTRKDTKVKEILTRINDESIPYSNPWYCFYLVELLLKIKGTKGLDVYSYPQSKPLTENILRDLGWLEMDLEAFAGDTWDWVEGKKELWRHIGLVWNQADVLERASRDLIRIFDMCYTIQTFEAREGPRANN